MLKIIRKSMINSEKVDMIYMDYHGKVSKRRVQPYLLKENTFLAYCYLRNARRIFSVDHVLALVPVMKKDRKVG